MGTPKTKISTSNSQKYQTNSWRAERGDPFEFVNIHSVAKHQKIEGGPLSEKSFEKKFHNSEKNEKGPFSLTRLLGMAPYAENRTTVVFQFVVPNDPFCHLKVL